MLGVGSGLTSADLKVMASKVEEHKVSSTKNSNNIIIQNLLHSARVPNAEKSALVSIESKIIQDGIGNQTGSAVAGICSINGFAKL